MKNPIQSHKAQLAWLAVLGMAACGATVSAQNASPAPAAAQEPGIPSDQAQVLTPFDVTAGRVGPYQATESSSGGRVAVNLFDTTQSIIVVTSQLAEDLGAVSPLDSLQYFPGIGRGPEPEGSGAERLSIRGFQIINSELDGIDDANGDYFNRNQMSAMLDRIEVVMGTDSILNPAGVPGGTLNFVTKKPAFSGNFGDVQVDIGKWNTDQATFDINRLVTKNLAFRVIFDGVSEDDYASGDQRGYDALVEGSWRFRNGSVLTLQYHYSYGYEVAGNQTGIPIDPSSGTLTHANLLQGLDPNASQYLDENMYNTNVRDVWTLLWANKFNDNFSTRFAARVEANNERQLYASGITAVNGTGGSYDPLTGDFTGGFTYGPAPTYTAIPIPAAQYPGAMYNASISYSTFYITEYEVQDDYVFQFERGGVNSLTMAGVAANITKEVIFGSSYAAEMFNIFTPSPIPVPNLNNPVSQTWTSTYSNFANLYVSEVAKLFKGRLSIGASGAKDWNLLNSVGNGYLVQGVPTPFSATPSPLFFNYGGSFKITPDLVFYYGHTESATPSDATPNSIPYVDETTGKQDEEGLRFKFLNGKAMATVCYYQLNQNNYSVINPGNEVSPAPVPALPALLLDRSDRGWEFGVNGQITDEVSAILSYTNFRNRDPHGIPLRAEPENDGAGWIHYDGKEGIMKNVGFGIGYVHEGKVGAVTATGVTAASTSTNVIPNQQTFYLPSNGIWNVTASYKWRNWTVRAFVDNVFDHSYLAASINRDGVWPGTPINPRGSITFSF